MCERTLTCDHLREPPMESTSELAGYSGGSQPRPAAQRPQAAHVGAGEGSGAAAHQPTSHTAQPGARTCPHKTSSAPRLGSPPGRHPLYWSTRLSRPPGEASPSSPADFLAVQCTHAAAPREYLHLKKRSPESKIPILRKPFFPFIFKSSFYFR